MATNMATCFFSKMDQPLFTGQQNDVEQSVKHGICTKIWFSCRPRAICPQVWCHQHNFWVWRWRRQSKMPDILWHVEPKQVAALYNSDMGSHLSRVLILQRHQHLQFASTRHLIGILLDPQQLDMIFENHRLFLILLPWPCWHLLGHWWHQLMT